MSRLTDKEYWEDSYRDSGSEAQPSRQSGFKRWLRQVLGPRLLDLMSPYDDFLLWRVLFPRFLPRDARGLIVVEIGSAPGDFLVRFARVFRATPYGIEYTRSGAERNRMIFVASGLNPDNVIETDFLDRDVINSLRDRFDIVISRGFIEHFVDAKSVVERHIAVLKPGGILFVLIPNFRGIYYFWTLLFHRDLLKIHNLEIMRLERFRSLFDNDRIQPLYVNYYGTFNFWLFTAPRNAWWRHKTIRVLVIVQRLLNLVFRIAFRDQGCETRWFSPNLIFVGRKTR